MSVVLPIVDLHTSPHAGGLVPVDRIMLNVVYALCPVALFAVFQFGLSALCLIAVCVSTSLVAEHAVCRMAGRATSVGDYSVVITGILLALTLPPGFPLWMAAVGSVVSVALGKALFGGIGFNVFNPALVGRAFLQAAFPVAITTWTPPFATGRFSQLAPSSLAQPFMVVNPSSMAEWTASLPMDGFTGATPLALQKFDQTVTGIVPLFTGATAGSTGETSALLILACGAYLIFRNMMNWRIPAAMLLGAFCTGSLFYVLDSAAYPSPFFILFSGGLILGAMFMASDMVGSPVTPIGLWIYGLFIGFLTVIIRLKGGLPEGVMYAILLGNAITPIIDSLTQPKVFGATGKEGASP
ncbi:MAG TPA: RnfABCDGE type electron transport complex subunit D [Gammaproteobacteria bacterium]|jgi:electron transport complex protein RnfD|nr:RnfABCDGE type electron transport complex subunit D [Candidatus Hydrogenedentota bacterium]HJP35621.1 RnfABCDGE type electron transport complex subunit D [Gammaproteobacteria bacterium]